jgi:hypothetical protein
MLCSGVYIHESCLTLLGFCASVCRPALFTPTLHVMCYVCAFVCVRMDANLRVGGMHAENKRPESIGQWLA